MRSLFTSLSARIYAVVALSLIVASALTLYMSNEARDQAYDLRNDELHRITDTSISLLADLQERVENGTLSLDEAQTEGRRLLEVVRFKGSGYMFAFDLDGVMKAHPFRPNWIGENQIGVEDVTGIKIFQEFINNITADGASRLTYYFNNPDTDAIEPKLGYGQMFEPWGWLVGTGSYVADIEAALASLRIAAAIGLALGITLLLVVSTLIIRSVLNPLAALQNRMNELADGDLASDIPGLRDKSEIGKMANAVEEFRTSLVAQKALEQEQLRADEDRQRVIGTLSERLSMFATGNLTVRFDDDVPQEYAQVATDFNAAVEQVSDAIKNIVSGVATIHQETNALDSASNDLGRRTETQAASLEETTAALNELSNSVKDSADDSKAAAHRVEQASARTESGAEVVQNTIQAMRQIEVSSEKIANITSLIDDIAFQTSLLALNTGVEAARAGEAGRGFAVVAGEVRALAAKSSEAAQDIATLISDATREIKVGASLAEESGTALGEINELIVSVKGIVSSLADSAQEQSLSLSEITTAAHQLDQVTQQNAAMFGETSASTLRLRDEANRLATDSGRFALQDKESAHRESQASQNAA